eukprot:TRINITY_DN505_c0_g1_i3.p1 TRINITY_DN505_c0_g1~~TRINITY_DN505_c0_g1_i3.p1  ORF type:complete len:578 (-),score=120.79 TRINITY_DN505_c0_g1_i3:256-1989(-)
MATEDYAITQTLEVFTDVDAGDTGAWGRLLSTNPKLPRSIDLISNEIVIGRAPSCDVSFDDKRISAKHCKIVRLVDERKGTGSKATQDVYLVEDLSTNGTFINKKKIGKGQKSVITTGAELALSLPTSTKDEGFLAFHFLECTRDEPGPAVDSSHIEAYYDIQKVLGTGNFASVNLAIKKSTGDRFAVKIIDKKKFFLEPNLRPEQLKDEVAILSSLKHPNIVQIVEVFETDEKMYLVMELVTGGELFDSIIEKGHFAENDARKCFAAILRAVSFLHQRGIAHRDLKPENILLAKKEDVTSVKISDFGLARIFGDNEAMKTMCGTPQYLAPEVLASQKTQSTYSKAIDCWSLGVILYILLCGCFPFFERKGRSMYTAIQKGEFSFPENLWKDMSTDSQDLIRNLLTVDPKKRFTAEQALQHRWVASVLSDTPSLKSLPSVAGLRDLFGSKFKAAAKAVMATSRISRGMSKRSLASGDTAVTTPITTIDTMRSGSGVTPMELTLQPQTTVAPMDVDVPRSTSVAAAGPADSESNADVPTKRRKRKSDGDAVGTVVDTQPKKAKSTVVRQTRARKRRDD